MKNILLILFIAPLYLFSQTSDNWDDFFQINNEQEFFRVFLKNDYEYMSEESDSIQRIMAYNYDYAKDNVPPKTAIFFNDLKDIPGMEGKKGLLIGYNLMDDEANFDYQNLKSLIEEKYKYDSNFVRNKGLITRFKTDENKLIEFSTKSNKDSKVGAILIIIE